MSRFDGFTVLLEYALHMTGMRSKKHKVRDLRRDVDAYIAHGIRLYRRMPGFKFASSYTSEGASSDVGMLNEITDRFLAQGLTEGEIQHHLLGIARTYHKWVLENDEMLSAPDYIIDAYTTVFGAERRGKEVVEKIMDRIWLVYNSANMRASNV